MVVRGGSLGLAGGPLFDYRDAACAGDSSAFESALKTAAKMGLPFTVEGVRGKAAADRWSGLSPQQWTAAPVVSVKDMSAESFAAAHSRGRRALRRLIEKGAKTRRVKATPGLVERIYRQKSKEPNTHGSNVFHDARCIAFMVATVSLPSTICEVFLLEMEQEPIAGLVTFIDGPVRRFYTTWMDPAWSKHSPGVALLFEATRQMLEERLDCDYMTGEQPYKLRFATGTEPLYRVEASAEQLAAIGSKRKSEVIEVKAA
jgi:CelD/BcsL family acetyltransferase involved in cellulose biosynthesis